MELTPREVEVLRLVARRMTDQEIAARLHISIHTVKFHIKNICSKLGAKRRGEAVLIALEGGILGPEDIREPRD